MLKEPCKYRTLCNKDDTFCMDIDCPVAREYDMQRKEEETKKVKCEYFDYCKAANSSDLCLETSHFCKIRHYHERHTISQRQVPEEVTMQIQLGEANRFLLDSRTLEDFGL